jgi:hypothetical protein
VTPRVAAARALAEIGTTGDRLIDAIAGSGNGARTTTPAIPS